MRTFVVSLFATVVTATLFAACGGSTQSSAPPETSDAGATNTDGGATTFDAATAVDATPDVDNGSPSDTYPAPHPDLPQIVTAGGPTLTTPRVVPIFFPGYAYKTQVIDYLSKVGATAYWGANVKEYGVGAITAGTAIELTEMPPTMISDMEIQQWLIGKLDGTHPEFGTPDPSTIYTLYYPDTTTIDLQGSTSCVACGGYHENVDIGGKSYPYAVIPQCAKFHALVGIDVITGTTAHELLEAATDPYPATNPAYGGVDDDHLVWEFVIGGGENGDMCSPFDSSFYKPAGFDYTVQRAWSNAAAKAGKDPCVPGLVGLPYFNSAPILPDTITLNFGGQATVTKGITIPVGQTKTIEIALFSEAKTAGPWKVTAKQPSRGGMMTAPTLDLKLDRTTGVNGEKLHLTIKVLSASMYKAESFMIVSELGTQKAYWAGMVGN